MYPLSIVPGRVRFFVEGLRGDICLKDYLERELLKIRGVDSVEANHRTGRLLVMFDCSEVDIRTIADTCLGILRKYHQEGLQTAMPKWERTITTESITRLLKLLAEQLMPKPVELIFPLFSFFLKKSR